MVITLWSLGDVNRQLAPERVDAHHAAVGCSVSERWDLVVVAWYTVESLSDVCRPFQNDLLRDRMKEPWLRYVKRLILLNELTNNLHPAYTKLLLELKKNWSCCYFDAKIRTVSCTVHNAKEENILDHCFWICIRALNYIWTAMLVRMCLRKTPFGPGSGLFFHLNQPLTMCESVCVYVVSD